MSCLDNPNYQELERLLPLLNADSRPLYRVYVFRRSPPYHLSPVWACEGSNEFGSFVIDGEVWISYTPAH